MLGFRRASQQGAQWLQQACVTVCGVNMMLVELMHPLLPAAVSGVPASRALSGCTSGTSCPLLPCASSYLPRCRQATLWWCPEKPAVARRRRWVGPGVERHFCWMAIQLLASSAWLSVAICCMGWEIVTSKLEPVWQRAQRTQFDAAFCMECS